MSVSKSPISMIMNPEALQRGEPLAELMRSMRLSGVSGSNVEVRAPYAVEVPQPPGTIMAYFITAGHCTAKLGPNNKPFELKEGDALILPHGTRHVLADSPRTRPVSLETILRGAVEAPDNLEHVTVAMFKDPFIYGGHGRPTAFTVLRLFYDEQMSGMQLSGLPDFVHLVDFIGRNRPFVMTTLAQIGAQVQLGLSGQNIAIRFAEALFIQCLTELMATGAKQSGGYCRGIRDPVVSRVIGAIQHHPDADWSIAKLVRVAGLSRSGFIDRFRSAMEMTPGQFVTTVRLARAAELLANTNVSIAEIANLAGYGSEAAFNRAFRKWNGLPPGILRRKRQLPKARAVAD